MKNVMILVPFPKRYAAHEGGFSLNPGVDIVIPPDEKNTIFAIAERLKEAISHETHLAIPVCMENSKSGTLFFERCGDLSDEGYRITIDTGHVKMEYAKAAGAFHAVTTLTQIIAQCGRKIPCLSIEDEPDYPVRGVLLDISRNKIPTMKSLFGLIDILSELKINHLQLYMEGFPFAYPSFPEVWQGGDPMTGEELMRLDRYCRDRFIDLVPNQNSFGHMSAWLKRAEFEKLAESSSGTVNSIGLYEPSSTLNPSDPGSVTLLERLYDDLLPNFNSDYFNVGLDEPFELGKGKSKERCEKMGTGRVYLDFLLKVHRLVSARHKTMLFWGDILSEYPELIQEIPKDTIVQEWGYESDHPFDINCRRYQEAGLSFYVCPGTGSWKSVSGRSRNMQDNIKNAVINGKKYGAKGCIITDWGDYGHWQYQPISYAGMVYGAALSWNVQADQAADSHAYLDAFVYRDTGRVTAQNIQDMGNYYLLEDNRLFNCTHTARILYTDIPDLRPLDDVDDAVFSRIETYITDIIKRLDMAEMRCEDARLIDEELRNACRLILHGTKLAKLKIMLRDGTEIEEQYLHDMIRDIGVIMNNHMKVWLARNRAEGLLSSIQGMQRLQEQYGDLLQTIKNNADGNVE